MFALFGLFGIGNIGNDSTVKAMIHSLRIRRPEATLLCITTAPDSFAEKFDLPAIYLSSHAHRYSGGNAGKGRFARIHALGRRISQELHHVTDSLRQLREVERLVIVGTGILDDFGVKPTFVPYLLFRWCLLARLSRVPIHFVSIGAGPIVHPLSRFFFVNSLRMSNYCSFRDQISRDYMKGVGYDRDRDRVFPDLAFSLPVHEVPGHSQLLQVPKTIGVGVMGYYGWDNDPSKGEETYRAYKDKITAFAIWLMDEGYDVRLLIGENSDRRAVNDVISAVAGYQKALSGSISVDAIENGDNLLQAMAKTDLVVASRFHNIIFSLMLGRPCISIGYARKFEVLLEDMGLSGYSQHIEQLDLDRLKQQFLTLVSDYVAVQQRINTKTNRYRDLLNEQYDTLLGKEPVNVGSE